MSEGDTEVFAHQFRANFDVGRFKGKGVQYHVMTMRRPLACPFSLNLNLS